MRVRIRGGGITGGGIGEEGFEGIILHLAYLEFNSVTCNCIVEVVTIPNWDFS
jgi:hypothetical protein